MQTSIAFGIRTKRTQEIKKAFPVEKALIPYISSICAENLKTILRRKGNSRDGWKHWRDTHGNWQVDINSISDADRERYGIPANEVIATMLPDLRLQLKPKHYNKMDRSLRESIDEVLNGMIAAKKQFHKYSNEIRSKYAKIGMEKAKEFAEKCAVWEWIIESYTRKANSGKIYYEAYCRVFPDHLTKRNSFDVFKTSCQKSIIDTVIDKRLFGNAQKRITTEQEALLQSLYIQPNKITPSEAHLKLRDFCKQLAKKAYSLSSVKKYFNELERNVELFGKRYGTSAAEKQLPYASLISAKNRNTQWQQDGWTLPFWGDKFQRYTLYLVFDEHSRKIVGWSVAESEDTELILNAMENAMRETGVFPGELVSDKHSFHRTKDAIRLKAETEKMGAIWTVTTQATRNGIAERYNQYLDSLCKDYPGYLGKNITSKGKDSRPSPEHLTQLGKSCNQLKIEEIKAISASIVTKYNMMKFTALNGMTPNEAYDASEDKYSFKISESKIIELVKRPQELEVRNGQIVKTVGGKKHEFLLRSELAEKYNHKKLLVCYEDLNQGIYISDPKTGEELGFVEPKPKMHRAVCDQTENDRMLLNQLNAKKKSMLSKSLKKAQLNAPYLKDNPEAVDILPQYSMPKDIRREAQQDMELKKVLRNENIDVNMMPIRQIEAETIDMPTKTSRNPYAPKKPELKTLYE